MQVDLITSNKSRNKEVHATVNGKHTACRINLTKPENIGHFTSIGQMKDIVQITCEKCKNSIAKQLIRESNKEMKAMLKEEQKMLKREVAESRPQKNEPSRNASPIQAPASHASAANNDGGYIPPSMRKIQQAAAAASSVPDPEPPEPISIAPPQMPTPQGTDVLSQFNIPNVPTLAQSAAATAPVHNPVPMNGMANSANDVLAQFNIPQVPTMPQSAPAPAPMANGVANSAEDVLAQFNIPPIPGTPQPVPTPMNVPTAPPMNGVVDSAEDVLKQFSIPPQMPTPTPAPADDVLSQFAVPNVPTAAPVPEMPESTPMPSPISPDDVLSQFAIPSVNPAQPPKAAGADDILAQFTVPNGPQNGSVSGAELPAPEIPSLDVPVQPSASQPMSDPEDILAQFSMASKGTAGGFEKVANDVFGAGTPNVEAPKADALNGQIADNPVEGPDSFGDLAAQIASQGGAVEVETEPAPNDYDPFDRPVIPIPANPADTFARPVSSTPVMPAPMPEQPVTPPVRPIIDNISDAADLFVMPGQAKDTPIEVSNLMTASAAPQSVPDIATVPTAPTALPDAPELVSVPTSLPQMPPPVQMPQPPIMPQQPSIGYPQQPMGYPQQPYPQMPYGQPMMQQPMGYPQFQQPYINPYMNQQVNLYAVPKAVEPQKPNTPPPLFVGYSADGRQLFQTYDELGKPIPINETVYSAPPQQNENPFAAAAKGVGITPGLQQGGAPVLDVEELMAAMGIEDSRKKKNENEKEIVFTEFKMPDKKKKAVSSAQPVQKEPEQTGPISAAEAKRRKKLERINKEFERQLKQLEEQGLDPTTGAFVGRKK